MIECETIYGGTCMKKKEDLRLRISAYGFIINDEKILVAKLKSSNKYFVPGGGVDVVDEDNPRQIKETISEGLKREVKEETGLEVNIGEHFYFIDTFFNYNPKDRPEIDESYYSHCHFYLCEPITLDFCNEEDIDDEECQFPEWVGFGELNEENCQPLFWKALKKYKQLYGR